MTNLSADDIKSLINSELAKKLYSDALSDPLKQIGKIGTDALKTLRLFTAPIQLLATLQDKLDSFLIRVRSKVPVERQIEAPAQIVGPIFDNFKYINENDELIQLYEELLSRSIDKDRINEAHPSFVHIISQLSRDEAIIISKIKNENFNIVDKLDYDDSKKLFSNRIIQSSTCPVDDLYYKDNFEMYISHLDSLNILEWLVYLQEPIYSNTRQIGVTRYSNIQLTDFGRLFAKACIPEKGLIIRKI